MNKYDFPPGEGIFTLTKAPPKCLVIEKACHIQYLHENDVFYFIK